jgi:ABC-type Zn uptake system ZnuABC Zn-binding protein ZnuA
MSIKELSAEDNSIAVDASGIANRTTINISKASKYSSLLNPLLERIISNYHPDSEIEDQDILPNPDEKIKFNDVKVFSEEIEECVGFLSLVEEQMDIIDDEEPSSKAKFMRAINQKYKEKRKALFIANNIDPNVSADVISIIRANADSIIQDVSDTILGYAEADLHGHAIEEVKDSIRLIVCHGFINCNILEKPSDYQ